MSEKYSTKDRLEEVAKMAAEETVKQLLKVLEKKANAKSVKEEAAGKAKKRAAEARSVPNSAYAPCLPMNAAYSDRRNVQIDPITGRIVIAPRRKRGA